jgi:hypothetical protein
VEPKEIFDQNFWQVSEEHPAYWLAQLRKREWTRLLLLLSMKPARSANKPVLAGRVLERLVFKVCDTRLDVYKAWQTNPGSIVIQFRHSETDWFRGIPEILPPDKGDQLGFMNIAGRLVCKLRADGAIHQSQSPDSHNQSSAV